MPSSSLVEVEVEVGFEVGLRLGLGLDLLFWSFLTFSVGWGGWRN